MSIYEKAPGRWFIRYRSGSRDIRRYAGPTRELAEQALAVASVKEARERILGVRETPSVTFSAFRPRFASLLAAKSPRWAVVSMGHFDAIAEIIGSVPLKDITPAMVEDLLLRLRDQRGLRNATVNRYRSTMSALMKAAVDRGLAEKNPVAAVRAAREEVKPIPWFGLPELHRLIAAVPPEHRALVIMAAETGLRRGELGRLEWRDVSLDRRAVTVRQSKSGRPRDVPLTAWATETLSGIPREATPLRGPALVWPGLDLNQVSRDFPSWTVKAGLPRMSFHGLRHGFASRLMRKGVDPATIMRLGGWASLSMVMRYGSHAPADAGRAAIGLLNEPAERRAATA